MTKPLVIIQTSPHGTASTVLVNLLYGFLIPSERILLYEKIDELKLLPGRKYHIVKAHFEHIRQIMVRYAAQYDLYFICRQRAEGGHNMPAIYHKWSNVLFFNYTELNETSVNSVENIVEQVYTKLHEFLPEPARTDLNKAGGVQRLQNMNSFYKKIKLRPFDYFDTFYSLHGSHRNRPRVSVKPKPMPIKKIPQIKSALDFKFKFNF